MTDNTILEVDGITKVYGRTRAVDNVSFAVKAGECIALIGPNGSGKTTLIKIINSLILPDTGHVLIKGKLQSASKPTSNVVGYTPDEPPAYDYLTGQEYLELVASLRRVSKSQFHRQLTYLLSLFPIKHLLPEAISTYSRGNKQKLVFLASLLSNPDLIIVDEPIVGLDPKSILAFQKHLLDLKKAGKAVLIASHILDFASVVADRALLLKDGHVVKEVTKVSLNNLTKAYFDYD